ncbi:hypothetical protein L249_2335 [Ophiocordyceps polyrhachis-furcata BCC 54312]|uniref:Uncharacterized protein n=1 Tax=Ophiocordyceps polyrhachis-furcata BCC 54312 TaxID=1330021 RepID=A0A367LNS5_9HYPO|nr:hypothetical protein L249_2335 [Ophiocordyceps polyrhachis-furcata BCC 54312]
MDGAAQTRSLLICPSVSHLWLDLTTMTHAVKIKGDRKEMFRYLSPPPEEKALAQLGGRARIRLALRPLLWRDFF